MGVRDGFILPTAGVLGAAGGSAGSTVPQHSSTVSQMRNGTRPLWPLKILQLGFFFAKIGVLASVSWSHTTLDVNSHLPKFPPLAATVACSIFASCTSLHCYVATTFHASSEHISMVD